MAAAVQEMMKSDSQHLEYLISQYLDGTLDAESRRLVEQELARNPEAQALLREQHEVQDLLDDWGNRIPMIDWAKFDAQLTSRLDAEESVMARNRRWRRWVRPAAVAAGLLVAAVAGYAWHAGTQPTQVARNGHETAPVARGVQVIDQPSAKVVAPVMVVEIVDRPRKPAQPAVHVAISEPMRGTGSAEGGVAVEPASAAGPQKQQPGTVTAGALRSEPDRDTLH